MTGGAFVFGVANYDAKVVGSHIDGTGGNELYVRPDSPIAQVKGYNPTYPDVLGSPETVKGAKIIMATGTTSQLCAVKWLEAVGVQEEDVELVNMEYAAGYQAFLAGQADVYKRQSIRNGADSEISFSMSDFFINEVEKQKTEAELQVLLKEILSRFRELVDEAQQQKYPYPCLLYTSRSSGTGRKWGPATRAGMWIGPYAGFLFPG